MDSPLIAIGLIAGLALAAIFLIIEFCLSRWDR